MSTHYTDWPLYPTEILSLSDYPTQIDDIDFVYAWLLNALANEVIAMQAELGTLPKGDYDDVRDRLNTQQKQLSDDDADTKIQVERTPDDDTIYAKIAGTDALILSPIRSLTLPNQPSVFAYPSTNQDLWAWAWTHLNIDTILYDLNSNYNITTKIFTAPESGIYLTTLHLHLYGLDTNTGAELVLYLNGAQITRSRSTAFVSTPNTDFHVTLTYTLNLAPNDELKPYARAYDDNAMKAPSTYWTIHKIA